MIHMTVALYKKDGMTKEEFDDYWANTHGNVFMGNPVARTNLVKYSQQHISLEATKQLAEMGFKTPSADGIAHFYAESLEKLLAVFDHEYYKNVVVPDEHNFIKASGRPETIVGVDDDKWADGKAGAGVDSSKW